MERVVVLGRGAAGKSTAARQLGEATGLPVIELDKLFWQPGPTPTPHQEWIKRQQELAATKHWIMDGDLGPYDALSERLTRADTVLILDFCLARCAWQALHRSRERADFWWWLLTWRWRYRPAVLTAVRTFAAIASVHHLRNPRQLQRFLTSPIHQ